MTILCLNISDIAIITVKNVEYCSIVHDIKKFKVINLLKNYVIENCGHIQKMHILEINIKDRVYNYHFDNLVKAKNLETKNVLINEKKTIRI